MPLAETSLAYALHGAATAVAEVIAGRNLNEALADLWRRLPDLPSGQRGAMQDLAYGALRRFGHDDFHLSRLMDKPPHDGQVRALVPWPKTYTFWRRPGGDALRLILEKVHVESPGTGGSEEPRGTADPGTVLIASLAFVLVNLLVDISYGFFDPRIRYQ